MAAAGATDRTTIAARAAAAAATAVARNPKLKKALADLRQTLGKGGASELKMLIKGDVDGSVEALLKEEDKAGLTGTAWVEPFRKGILRSKLELYRLLADINAKGQKVYAISAPSRASTLVNYVGLDDQLIPCVMEIKGSKKIGKYMPGRNIPVLEESKLYDDQPEFALLLSWHIADELTANLKKRGYKGDFIVPLPLPRVVKNKEVQ